MFRRLFPGFALVARGSSRSDVLKVAVWLQPTGGAPRISIASRSDACYTQRVHATQPRQLHHGRYLHQSPLPRCLQHQRPRALAAAGHAGARLGLSGRHRAAKSIEASLYMRFLDTFAEKAQQNSLYEEFCPTPTPENRRNGETRGLTSGLAFGTIAAGHQPFPRAADWLLFQPTSRARKTA